MFPRIFCLHSSKVSPTIFRSSDDDQDVGWKNTNYSELSYTCKLEQIKGAVSQILVFTEGSWPDDYSDCKIDIFLSGQAKKFCSLTKSSRCFLWSKDECKHGYELLPKGESSFTLQASIQGSFPRTPAVKETTKFSSPVPSLREGEIMQKTNESTPEVPVTREHSVPVESKTPCKKQKKEISEEKTTSTKTSNKSKKRQLDKENSPIKTPRLKAARSRGGSRIFGHEKTPPTAKRILASPKTRKESDQSADDKCKEVRCVQMSSRVPKPSSRWGHSMCMVDEKMAVLIGGQGNKMQLSKDSVWSLNTECRSWKSVEVKTEGVKPECRTGHSATYDPTVRCIYIFGGSKNSKWFHDVHMYDLDEQKWSLVKANGKAPTRAYHSATLYRHELWMFGGVFPRPDPQPDGCDNELHIFSPVMEGWYKPIVTGDKPLPRSGHSATLVEDRLVVFGGWDFPFCYNDVHILDMTTVDWSAPNVQGEPPKQRCWAASSALTNSRVFLHGGYDGDNPLDDAFIFDLDNYSWQKLVLTTSPSARAGHAAIRACSSYEDKEEDEIIIFGGGDNDGNFFSNMLSFYVPYIPAILD